MSLWADIDDYLRTELITELGADGSYTTQVVKQVIVDDIMDFTGATAANNYRWSLCAAARQRKRRGRMVAVALGSKTPMITAL